MGLPVPQYNYALVYGLNNAGALLNVEHFIAGGKYFPPPALKDDFVLEQKLSSGEDFERGFSQVIWAFKLWRVQYAYLYTTTFAGSYSAPVTFRTRRGWSNETYHVYDGYVSLNQLSPAQRNYKLYTGVELTFTRLRFIS